MTTNRIEAARLTDEELLSLPQKYYTGVSIPPRTAADAATAKALAFQDARRKALVEALRAVYYDVTGKAQKSGSNGEVTRETFAKIEAALKGEA